MDFPIRPVQPGCEIEILDEFIKGQSHALPVVFAHTVFHTLRQGLQTVKIPDAEAAMRDAAIRGYIVTARLAIH